MACSGEPSLCWGALLPAALPLRDCQIAGKLLTQKLQALNVCHEHARPLSTEHFEKTKPFTNRSSLLSTLR